MVPSQLQQFRQWIRIEQSVVVITAPDQINDNNIWGFISQLLWWLIVA